MGKQTERPSRPSTPNVPSRPQQPRTPQPRPDENKGVGRPPITKTSSN